MCCKCLVCLVFTADHLPELASLLRRNLPSLRVLDLSDNTICDLPKITTLVTTATSIRSINLSGNPAFVSSNVQYDSCFVFTYRYVNDWNCAIECFIMHEFLGFAWLSSTLTHFFRADFKFVLLFCLR